MQKKFTSFLEEFNNPTDEQIVELSNQGNTTATNFLIDKYSPIVNMKANKFFINGAEHDDIVQEGLIGLYKAIKSFDSNKDNSFKTFANLCVERQLITAIKTSNRQKHIPLNQSVSLNMAAYDENYDTTLLEILDTAIVEDPLETITKQEQMQLIKSRLKENLSEFEVKVISLYIQGISYVEIAKFLNSTPKSVDNAIQRIRKKAFKVFNNDNESQNKI